MKELSALMAAAALVVAGVAVANAQAVRDVTMQIRLPGGASPILRVRNGEIGTIMLGEAGTFGLRPRVQDETSGLVSVSVIEDARPDGRILAELDATVGGPAVGSGTTPPFTVAITRILER